MKLKYIESDKFIRIKCGGIEKNLCIMDKDQRNEDEIIIALFDKVEKRGGNNLLSKENKRKKPWHYNIFFYIKNTL